MTEIEPGHLVRVSGTSRHGRRHDVVRKTESPQLRACVLRRSSLLAGCRRSRRSISASRRSSRRRWRRANCRPSRHGCRRRRSSSTSRAGAHGRPAMAARSSRSCRKARDIRYISVYAYTRLVGYDEKLEPEAGHPRERSTWRRPGLHLHAARGPPLVRRYTVHGRGFPLLLGGRRAQQGAVARPARPEFMIVDGKPPKLRGPGRAARALHLGRAQSALPAALAGAARLPHLSAGALSQAVPREIRRQGEAGGARQKQKLKSWAALHNRMDDM